MGFNQVIGFGLLVVAGVMLYLGYMATQGVGEQLHETIMGRFTDSTMWYFVVAAVAAAAGVGVMAFRGRA